MIYIVVAKTMIVWVARGWGVSMLEDWGRWLCRKQAEGERRR